MAVDFSKGSLDFRCHCLLRECFLNQNYYCYKMTRRMKSRCQLLATLLTACLLLFVLLPRQQSLPPLVTSANVVIFPSKIEVIFFFFFLFSNYSNKE